MTIEVRPLGEDELGEVDAIYRRAFGALHGLRDPLGFEGDARRVACRFATDPDAALGLFAEGSLRGSGFVSRWGSVGLLGPITVDPKEQGRGLAHPLLRGLLRLLSGREITLRSIGVPAADPRCVGLLQRFGFWPTGLSVLMAKEVGPAAEPAGDIEVLSGLSEDDQAEALTACRELTESVFPGLDATGEILALGEQGTGETVLVREGSRVAGVAVCHAGAGSEAGTGRAAVRLAVVPSGPDGSERLRRLLGAVEAWAVSAGVDTITVGTGSGRVRAWRALREAGWLPFLQSVTMHQDRHPGYEREDVFLLDDWR